MEADVNLDCALPSCQPIKRFQSANSDRKIILTTIFAEAKSESIEGQQWVIKNRTDIHSYWSTNRVDLYGSFVFIKINLNVGSLSKMKALTMKFLVGLKNYLKENKLDYQ